MFMFASNFVYSSNHCLLLNIPSIIIKTTKFKNFIAFEISNFIKSIRFKHSKQNSILHKMLTCTLRRIHNLTNTRHKLTNIFTTFSIQYSIIIYYLE